MTVMDLRAVLQALATKRPVFHSEADFQHALAWAVQTRYPRALLRLELRPRRGVHLDLLIRHEDVRVAVEIKYPVAALSATVDGELFDLPNHSAQDTIRHDIVKDVVRVEALLAAGYADIGYVVVVTNDGSYWRPNVRPDVIDAAFRLHDGRILEGTVSWGIRAGAGTMNGRDERLTLAGRYTCSWQDYSTVTVAEGRTTPFRQLIIDVPNN